ncbi:MAG: terminase [Algicola sp.]|nr:terminase [Algicola sp.]
MAYTEALKNEAKCLYLQHWDMKDIVAELNLANLRVLYQWREKHDWDAGLRHENQAATLARKVTALLDKPDPTPADCTKLKTLLECQNLMEKRKGFIEGTSPKRDKKEKQGKGKTKANDVDDITQDDCDKIADALFFGYQHVWRKAKLTERIRFILKSRQIGATYYFAYEALEDAIISGDNQIFMSASRAQALIFRTYVVAMGRKHFDVELKGNPIKLSNGAELHFLSTNAATAQGYHGHLYFDEVFWVYGFAECYKNASAMSSHKKWRRTLFSTPSTINHPAFKLWSGQKFNAGRDEADKVAVECSHAVCKDGFRSLDRIWRHIVTVKDAQRQGCNLFDIDELVDENSTGEFNNLFMCHFVDNDQSVFRLKDLLRGAVDSAEKWQDVRPERKRPYGDRPVWLGYDPSRTRDNAVLSIVAPPLKTGGKFRLLERIIIKGKRFQHHCAQIEKLIRRYKVDYIGVDVTGIGAGVFDYVKDIFPKATPISYGVETKKAMVLKAIDIMEENRFEYDASLTDVPNAFLTVKQTSTKGGTITYASNRTDSTGHGDVGWSIMHTFINEPINHKRQRKSEYG